MSWFSNSLRIFFDHVVFFQKFYRQFCFRNLQVKEILRQYWSKSIRLFFLISPATRRKFTNLLLEFIMQSSISVCLFIMQFIKKFLRRFFFTFLLEITQEMCLPIPPMIFPVVISFTTQHFSGFSPITPKGTISSKVS